MELAIVLVIIGLLVGGVLVGQDLIEQARINKVIKQVDQFTLGINAFRLKYNCYPGDCINAYEKLGASCGTDTWATAANGGGCNGNGDGIVNLAEGFRLWNHLGLAGMVPGNYDGVYSDALTIPTAKEKFPSGLNEATFYTAMDSRGPLSDTSDYAWDLNNDYGNIIGNVFVLGKIRPNAARYMGGAALNMQQVWYIDDKIDDGKYHAGRVSGHTGMLPDLSWASCDYGSSYNVSGTQPACVAVFTMGLRN